MGTTNFDIVQADSFIDAAGNVIGGGDLAIANTKILIGDASGVGQEFALSGDATMTAGGAVSVTDLTIASEARGDLLRRGASTWERVAAKTSGQILVGDGTDIASVAVSGDASLASSGAVTVTGAAAAFNVGTDVTMTKEVNHVVSVAASTTADTAGATLSIASAAGVGTGAGGALSYTSGAGANGAAAVNGAASGAVTVASGATGTSGTGTGGASGVVNVAAAAGGATTGAAGIGGKAGDVKLTGAAGGADGEAGSGTGGEGSSVILTAGVGGAGNTTGVSGVVNARGVLMRTQSVATAKTTTDTLTAAQILGGIITVDQGAGALSTQTTPTGTQLVAAMPTSLAAGDSLDFHVVNISTTAADIARLLGGTDVTNVGNSYVAAIDAATGLNPSSATFRFVYGSGTAWQLYRIS